MDKYDITKTVCFTGHRPQKLGGYDEQNHINGPIRDAIRLFIKDKIFEGYSVFISGMAMGVDTWAAEEVIALRKEHKHIRLVAAIPFRGQESKWPPETQRRYHNLIAQSDRVVEVCNPGYAPWKMQRRNEWMVDHSSLVFAVWDGTPGGTANCVAYATKHEVEVVRIVPVK